MNDEKKIKINSECHLRMSHLKKYALLMAVCLSSVLSDAFAAGTIPTVSGYSNSRKRAREFTTVGIVIQIEKTYGKAFRVRESQKRNSPLKVGFGLLRGDKIWLEHGAVVHLMDINGARYIASGPGVLRIEETLSLLNGSLYIEQKNSAQKTLVKAGMAELSLNPGVAAVWVDSSLQHVQVVSLAGKVYFWHHQLQDSGIEVKPSFYSQLFLNKKYLNPEYPQYLSNDKIDGFLARFKKEISTNSFDQHSEVHRQIASDHVLPVSAEGHTMELKPSPSNFRGSRKSSEIFERKDVTGVFDIVNARLRGQDFREKE